MLCETDCTQSLTALFYPTITVLALSDKIEVLHRDTHRMPYEPGNHFRETPFCIYSFILCKWAGYILCPSFSYLSNTNIKGCKFGRIPNYHGWDTAKQMVVRQNKTKAHDKQKTKDRFITSQEKINLESKEKVVFLGFSYGKDI